jgi:protein ImuB
MKRIICIRLPSWPIQRLVVAQPELKGRVIILHDRDPRRGQYVVACSRAAYRLGVRLGMSLTEAATFDSEAHIASHDPSADAEALAALAQWCERFSPLVGMDHPDTHTQGNRRANGAPGYLVLDATGLASHFGGEQAMARQIVHAFEQRGYCVRVAVAGTLGAAWALAHYATQAAQPLVSSVSGEPFFLGSTFLVVPAAATWAVLQSLPIRALRLPSDTVALLEQLGLLRIGQLAHLPRGSLASRFGDLLLQRWDQLLGQAAEVFVAHRAPPVFQAEMSLEHPTHRHSVLASLLAQLLDQVARALVARSEGVLELVCRFRCTAPVERLDEHREPSSRAEPAESLSLRIGLFQPTASVEHLVQLVQMQLEQLILPGWVEQVVVEAALTAPLLRRQRELFPDGCRHTPLQLAQLVDRLSSRLGSAAVVRPRLEADMQPEHAYRYAPLAGRRRVGSRTQPPTTHSLRRAWMARPLHLRSPPLFLAVVAIVPDGPPIRFHFQQRPYRVTRYWGPERIETGWWRGRSVRRDYYRVETDRGHWFWIFRRLDDGQWFLHGLFG